MRRILIFLVTLYLSYDLSAQGKWGADSVECITNLSLYREYYKQKIYNDALNPWRWTFLNCPQSSGNIYKNGPVIIKTIMKKDDENRSAYLDTLMQIYDKRIQIKVNMKFKLKLKLKLKLKNQN